MSLIRRLPAQTDLSLKELFNKAWVIINSICPSDRLHIVYDSYIEDSIKESERCRRNLVQPLDFYGIDMSSKMPVQTDRFWASNINKQELQKLSRSYLQEVSQSEKKDIVLSGYVDHELKEMQCVEIQINEQTGDSKEIVIEELCSMLEEADTRIIPHLYYDASKGHKRFVVVSNDTDVVVLILFYTHLLLSKGLHELWIKYGVGDHVRFLPMHYLAKKLGPHQCSVIMKAHILTGCDVTSKVGTKSAALQAEPTEFLDTFGEHNTLEYYEAIKDEEYLVKVLKPKSKSKTFNELRFEQYVEKKTNILQLAPTSQSIQGHLLRCHFVVRQNSKLLNDFKDSPLDFGWVEDGGSLIPKKYQCMMPSYYTVRCGCKKRCSGRCRCIKLETICTEFCGCRNVCNNKCFFYIENYLLLSFFIRMLFNRNF